MFILLLCISSVFLVRGREIDYVRPPQSEIPKLFETSISCIVETNVDADTLHKFITWTFKNSESVRKYLFCFMNKGKFADDDGHYIIKNIVHLVGNNKKKGEFERVLQECNKIEGKDKFDTLFKICMCAHDKTPILFSI